jgi:hypothetical protein
MISKQAYFWIINIITIVGILIIIKVKFFSPPLTQKFVHSSCAIFLGWGYIWLADNESFVQQFDLKGKFINKFNVGGRPSSVIAFSEFLVCTQNNGLSVIQTGNADVRQILAVPTLASTYDGSNVWALNLDSSNNVSIFDDTVWRNINTITAGYNPTSIAFDGNNIWVSLLRDGKVAVISRENYKVSTLPVSGHPVKVCADPGQKYIFALIEEGLVNKINMEGVQDTIQLPENNYLYTGIASDGKTLYIGDGQGILRFYDIASGNSTINPIELGTGLTISDIAVDNNNLYVFANGGGNGSSPVFNCYNKNTGELNFNMPLGYE